MKKVDKGISAELSPNIKIENETQMFDSAISGQSIPLARVRGQKIDLKARDLSASVVSQDSSRNPLASIISESSVTEGFSNINLGTSNDKKNQKTCISVISPPVRNLQSTTLIGVIGNINIGTRKQSDSVNKHEEIEKIREKLV